MTTTTMDLRAHVGANADLLQSWTPATVDNLRNDAAVSSAGLSMIYVVSGPQTHRGVPPPVIGAAVVSAALWIFLGVAVLNTVIF